ncbi:MAG: ADP-ribosylglycohydrolase family protein [Ruminiclostridium sp.]|nr:ADP-ribosylglycohydrolase family protein [Ruminiclostridium sp.]
MIGAITGDVAGSRFEFRNYRAKDFEIFSKNCFFTDDSVMTLAVAKALTLCENTDDTEGFKQVLISTMHEVGRKYPNSGYGNRFYNWVMQKRTEPYNSYGNGSAMRVSPVGWYASSLEECERLAAATAEVTHNHPEGIKGAVSVAGAIFLARTGHSMDEIKSYVSRYYTINFTIDEIRDSYRFNESCQGTVPQAFQAFFEATDFEDAIRTAVSVGGDSDTLAAITGSVAEAFYGIDDDMKKAALSYLDDYLLKIAQEFIGRYIAG